jgi:23S rRNA pseudouridine2605 synthase
VSSEGEALRLNQFLARAGLASRRAAETLIREGRVTVNGRTVTDLATSVVPGKDYVKVDGRGIRLPDRGAYFALYKPKEVVSTLEDPEGRECLKAFLPAGVPGLFPVGRLDYHSEGLLLLMSDGELSNRLLHPRFKVLKTYLVKVKGDPPQEGLDRLRRGILLEGRRTLPVTIRKIPSRETRHTWLKVEMTEGRKNQLREMFFRIEHPVIKLKRVAMGPVKLGELKPGHSRPLTREEVDSLKEAAGLSGPVEPKAPARRKNGWARPRPRTTQRREKEGSR